MDIVKEQLVYWLDCNADGTIANQNGLGLLTVGLAASVYTITMPANFTVPLNRRVVALTGSSAADVIAVYNRAGSANNTILVDGFTANTGAAINVAFTLRVYRILDEIGAGAG